MRKACLETIHECAKRDDRVVFIGSDLGAGTLQAMRDEFPDRFFMEGICEQNVIGMAAGLAMDGYIPFVNTIATFLTRRCLEQLSVDLCLHNLPVRLIGNGGGMVYAPLGPTHMATDDMALMRALPRMGVCAPTDADEMRRLIPKTLDVPGPLYIRLGKGGDPVVSRDEDGFEIGRAIRLREGTRAAIMACGVMVNRALAAAEKLAADGIECTVVNMHTVKPLDDAAVLDLATTFDLLVTVEEHSAVGGLGSAVADVLVDNHARAGRTRLKRLALPDIFPQGYGSQDELLARYGLQPDGIAASVAQAIAE